MSRVPIYPARRTLCAQVSIEIADALTERARGQQVPKRAVVEAALREYLNQSGVRSHESSTSRRWVSVGEQINIEQLADDVSEEICPAVVKGAAK
jgi:hypothetical protein